MRSIRRCFLWIFCIQLFDASFCGNVLFLPCVFSPSHKLAMATLADTLADRGHSVHWWAPASKLDKYQPTRVSSVDHFVADIHDRELLDALVYENDTKSGAADWVQEWSTPSVEILFTYVSNAFCESVLNNHRGSFERILKFQWDLIIVDQLFSTCGYLITQLTRAPVITYVSNCRRPPEGFVRNKDPVPYSYSPPFRSLSVLSDRMSFVERVLSTVSWILGNLLDQYYFDLVTKSLKQYYPDIKDITSGTDRPDFQFVCTLPYLNFPHPSMPNVVPMGGINVLTTPGKLPEDFARAVAGAKKGFIILTFGHWARWDSAPSRLTESFADAFDRLADEGYVIFWQYNGKPIENLHTNVKAVKWLPQKDLLAHSKCRLFITHCGCNGLIEAIRNTVPMVAIPLTADQPDDAALVVSKGFGVLIRKQEVTPKTLYNAIRTVLRDNSFKENIRKFNDIIANDIQNPLDRAVFWSEYTMRHKFRNPYKTPANLGKFSLVTYFSLDILLCFFVLFTIILCAIVLSCYVAVRLTRKNSNSNELKKKINKK